MPNDRRKFFFQWIDPFVILRWVDLAGDWDAFIIDPNVGSVEIRKGTNIPSSVEDFCEFVAKFELVDKF